MKVHAVLPSIYEPWTARCLASMSDVWSRGITIVDNTQTNRGVAASWNVGIDAMEQRGARWLVLISAAIRFGAPGGDDFLDALAADVDSPAVEATFMGWHLIAFRAETIERVGRFDEAFWPGYYEDIDYGRRAALAYRLAPPYWSKVECDVAHAGHGHGILLGGVEIDNAKVERTYRRKWGGPKGSETYRQPYNDRHCDHTFTGPHA